MSIRQVSIIEKLFFGSVDLVVQIMHIESREANERLEVNKVINMIRIENEQNIPTEQ